MFTRTKINVTAIEELGHILFPSLRMLLAELIHTGFVVSAINGGICGIRRLFAY